MQVTLTNAGKKFNHRWVFNNLSIVIEKGGRYAITGNNGSGKSTLIMMIAGYITPSQGNLQWNIEEKSIHSNDIYKHISIAAPYLELIEEFTLEEMIRFQRSFKPYKQELTINELVKLSLMEESRNKTINQFSSGMKQRLKLLLCTAVQSKIVLLDEPCSNLDADGIAWYQHLLDRFCKNRTVVIASNHRTEEYPGCTVITRLGQDPQLTDPEK
jgi:ABC-2 type transport system ATP-binding protein